MSTGKEKKNPGDTSWHNEEEVQACIRVAKLVNRKGFGWSDIVIITAYAGQKREVEVELQRSGIPIGRAGENGVQVGTVDSFQGAEAKVVIISTVRTTVPKQRLEDSFVADPGGAKKK